MPRKRRFVFDLGRRSRNAKRIRLQNSRALASENRAVSTEHSISAEDTHSTSAQHSDSTSSTLSPELGSIRPPQNLMSSENSFSLDHHSYSFSSPNSTGTDRTFSIRSNSTSLSRASESLLAAHSIPNDQGSSICLNSQASLTRFSPSLAVPVLTFTRTATSTNDIDFSTISLPGPSTRESRSTSDTRLFEVDAGSSTSTSFPMRFVSPMPVRSQQSNYVQIATRVPPPITNQVPLPTETSSFLCTTSRFQVRSTAPTVQDATNSGASTTPRLISDRQEDTASVRVPVAEAGEDTLSESLEVHDVPVRLPNYPAFHYNPQNQYDGARTGSMSATCLRCNAKKWPIEPPGMCCANGKVDVPLLGPPPEPLRALLTNNTPTAKEFRKKIRTYNSCFVMTSFQAHTLLEPGFMPTFKVQGQIYHK